MATIDELRQEPHWSYSALNTYLNVCQAQYFYRYVEQAEVERTSVCFPFGKAFHAALTAQAWECMIGGSLRQNELVERFSEAFRIDVPGLDKPLIGEFDLIVQDGRDACIVDWKTSASRWPAGKADRDLQATVFSYAYEKLNGKSPLFRFDVITKTKNPGCESHYTSRGFHDFRRFEALANRAQDAINKGVFLPNETSFACNECPYRDRCRQWHLKKWR